MTNSKTMPALPPRFPLGDVVATPGALELLERAGEMPATYLARHQGGDWGELSEEDRQENELSLQHGFRILSAHGVAHGERIWIITEADRSSTTILLPADY